MRLLRTQRGFTLIELLVVMTIIAILAVAMSVAFLRTSQSARDTTRKADLRNLSTKMEEYFKDKGAYPGALSDLTTGGYITTLPQDPKTKADYTYTPTPAGCTTAAGDCTSFSISATLENENDKDGDPVTHAFTVSNAQ
jgi:general secretion pathway protein G